MDKPAASARENTPGHRAVERAFDMYALAVQRYIYSKVGQVALAEDLTSEVFLRALRWLQLCHNLIAKADTQPQSA